MTCPHAASTPSGVEDTKTGVSYRAPPSLVVPPLNPKDMSRTKARDIVPNESEGFGGGAPQGRRGLTDRGLLAEAASLTEAASSRHRLLRRHESSKEPPSAGRRHESPENPEQVHAKSPIFWGLCDRPGACSVTAQYPPKVPEGGRVKGAQCPSGKPRTNCTRFEPAYQELREPFLCCLARIISSTVLRRLREY